MYHFCTISTADHLYKAHALYDSIRALHADCCLHVLIIDGKPSDPPNANIHYYGPDDVKEISPAKKIVSKYGASKDKLRWCLKPLFLRYLLEHKAERVIYVDNDIYFHGDYGFLFDLLGHYDFLLTPHHYPRDPSKNQNWLEANFKVGLYNAGFIGVNSGAVPSLEWWAECCAYRCEKSALRGTFDDQKYLDLIPVMNEKAHIVRHKGCNVAEWNRTVIPRSEKDGKVLLDGQYPLIFIHYTGTTVRGIRDGLEPCLKKSFDAYFANLQKYKSDVTIEQLMDKPTYIHRIKFRIWKAATDWGL
jgi:hypothetical protein